MSQPLLQKNTRFLLLWLPIVLLVCSLIFFILMQMQAHHMQEKQLLLKQRNVWTAFTQQPAQFVRHVTGEYDLVEGVVWKKFEPEPRDTTIYYTDKNKALPFEVLTAQYTWNGKTFQLSTYVSSTEISHLILKVFLTEAVILGLLLLTIVFLNQKSSRFLWAPFFDSVKAVNEYDITRSQSLHLPQDTGTAEFDELNRVLTNLIHNATVAYQRQKQFVENASHEMQTPLAIIRSKLELLINQPNLTERVASLLGDITEANDRLSQMNRTLLLITKIENKQFPETEEIRVATLLQQILDNYQEHYEERFPKLNMHIQEVTVTANRSLIEILLSNLVKNAIEHNQPEGVMNVTLSDKELTIENTGPALDIHPEELFERFKKGSYHTKTTGLGLSLVKQICLLYHYTITYQYKAGWHKVNVQFSKI
jgi:signal transduction histidine kinase